MTSVDMKQPVYFSPFVGIFFENKDPIANNEFLLAQLASLPEGEITKDEEWTSFNIEAEDFAFFMHRMYASIEGEDFLAVTFDGITPFEGVDEQGNPATFNAQSVTLMQLS